MEIIKKVREELKTVYDPELNINVVDLGLIYDIKQTSDRSVEIDMTLTTPGCPLHDSITSGVKHCVEQMAEIDQVVVNLVWQPAWSPDKMSDEAKRILR
ncbi:metal-sulfur cluster assembly factor [Bacillus sp. CGMCC 1.16607]|uniref:metal-sulfur cluster assembly factor n=1 Tax=Bacillus sp. CGMCC 1.16607 TaxID=3351842 RepID=UPI00362854E8